MAVAFSKPSYVPAGRCDYTGFGRRHRIRTLTFSGNYATNGETVNASDVGLNAIEEVVPHGQVAAASTPTSGNPIGVIVASTGKSAAIRFYELGGTGAAGDPLAEKTNAEAYVAGQNITCTFIGH